MLGRGGWSAVAGVARLARGLETLKNIDFPVVVHTFSSKMLIFLRFFEGRVRKQREGCLRQRCATRGKSV